MSDQPIPRDDPKEPVPPMRDPDDEDVFEDEDDQDIARHRDYGDEDPEPISAKLGWRSNWPTPDDFWS